MAVDIKNQQNDSKGGKGKVMVTKPENDSVEPTPELEGSAEVEASIDLTLALYQRHSIQGYMYERGHVYTLPALKAKQLLTLHKDGAPIFMRYKAPEAVSATPPEVEKIVVREKVEASAPEVLTSRELATDEELAELETPVCDEEVGQGDTSERIEV